MSKEDLKPCRDSAEAKRRGRNGGLASGEARRKKKALRELVAMALETEFVDTSGLNPELVGKTQAEAIAARLVRAAAHGNFTAMKMLFSLEGESMKQDESETESEMVEA